MEQTIYGKAAPHMKGKMSADKIMKYVILSLIPAGCYGVYRFGIYSGALILLTCFSAVSVSFLFDMIFRKKTNIRDGRILLNGLITAYCLPPEVELWVAVLAGGLCALIMRLSLRFFERNIVSPIILTRLILMWIFPVEMSTYTLDGLTMATPLALLREGEPVNTLGMIFGDNGGCIGETSALLLCLGAIFLIAREIIDFRVSGMYLFSFAAFMAIFGGEGLSSYYLTAHLAAGGFMLTLWYIAPAYSTLPMTKRGRLCYGIILGIFTGISRLYGTNPENLCYAVLAANLLVPVIEKVTGTLPFGIERGKL